MRPMIHDPFDRLFRSLFGNPFGGLIELRCWRLFPVDHRGDALADQG